MSKEICFDCERDITDKNRGARYPKRNGVDVWKCIECYEEEPELSQKALVYSRVVGYLSPVNQWNHGKKSEYSRRKVYKSKYEKKI